MIINSKFISFQFRYSLTILMEKNSHAKNPHNFVHSRHTRETKNIFIEPAWHEGRTCYMSCLHVDKHMMSVELSADSRRLGNENGNDQ